MVKNTLYKIALLRDKKKKDKSHIGKALYYYIHEYPK